MIYRGASREQQAYRQQCEKGRASELSFTNDYDLLYCHWFSAGRGWCRTVLFLPLGIPRRLLLLLRFLLGFDIDDDEALQLGLEDVASVSAAAGAIARFSFIRQLRA